MHRDTFGAQKPETWSLLAIGVLDALKHRFERCVQHGRRDDLVNVIEAVLHLGGALVPVTHSLPPLQQHRFKHPDPQKSSDTRESALSRL